MFEDIGDKLKGFAKFISISGIILCVIIGSILLFEEENVLMGLLVAIGGSLGSWLTGLCLYGFGELIENTADIRDAMYEEDDEEGDEPEDEE